MNVINRFTGIDKIPRNLLIRCYTFNLEPLLSQGKNSKISGQYLNFVKQRAFDGNLHQNAPSCAIVKNPPSGEQRQFIQVDLEKRALISSVKLYFRNDCCLINIQDASIWVSDNYDQSNAQECASFGKILNPSQVENFYCPPDIKGRYVELVNLGLQLAICEMQVFGHYIE